MPSLAKSEYQSTYQLFSLPCTWHSISKTNPILLDEEQVLDYLHFLKQQHKTPSDSFFKHTVYGLRYAYGMEGMGDMKVVLPSIERPKKLPFVLSKAEMHQLLTSPELLKHRLVLGMLYGCGVRCFELRKLLLRD